MRTRTGHSVARGTPVTDHVEISPRHVQERQSAVIADLPLAVAGATGGVDARLESLVRAAAESSGMRRATINLLDGDQQRQLGAHGFIGADSPREDSICAQVTGWTQDVYAFRD